MAVTVHPFGALSTGEEVRAYTITNTIGASCTLLDYGANIQAICVPNKNGGFTDVVLGYDSAAGYETGKGHLGGMIGRVGNRIGGARFSLNGKEYPLDKNNGEACLHGGFTGYDHMMWNAEILGEDAVRFSRFSPDGEQGFPGNLQVSVTYTLSSKGAALDIAYDAVSDQDTLFAPTNHSYFDLSGCGRAMEQVLWLNAPRYLELGEGTVPNGTIAEVTGTPFDFRKAKPVGQDVDADDAQLRAGGGYDHNFCIIDPHCASLESAVTGIRMDVHTSMPGVQLYSGNGLKEQTGKGGVTMGHRGAACLETQLWPDWMNHWGFPSAVLHAGEQAHSVTTYSFSVIK